MAKKLAPWLDSTVILEPGFRKNIADPNVTLSDRDTIMRILQANLTKRQSMARKKRLRKGTNRDRMKGLFGSRD